MPCKKTMDMGGAPPHTDNLIRSAAGGRRPNRTVEKTRRVRVFSLFSSSLATLRCSWTRRAKTRARLTWKPARWTLTTKPTIGGGLRPCQSRNGATKSTIAEESFPRWRHAAISSLHTRTTEGARAEHVTPETKNWTHAGKRTNSEPALNPSKQVQTEFLILIELVKIRSECSNETYVFVRDLLAGWLSYEIVKNVIL